MRKALGFGSGLSPRAPGTVGSLLALISYIDADCRVHSVSNLFVAGSSVFPALEGTRPVLVEIQALVVRLATGATPRRAAEPTSWSRSSRRPCWA